MIDKVFKIVDQKHWLASHLVIAFAHLVNWLLLDRTQRKGKIPFNEDFLVILHQQDFFCPDVVLFNLSVSECLYNIFYYQRDIRGCWKRKRIISKSIEGKNCFFIAVSCNFLKYG